MNEELSLKSVIIGIIGSLPGFLGYYLHWTKGYTYPPGIGWNGKGFIVFLFLQP